MEESELKKLAEPFPAEDIEWRIQQAGKKGDVVWAKVFAYVTNRAIQDRLDAVCGPADWRNEFADWQNSGVLCGLSILVDGEWVTKWDGAENTDFEAVKGGLSGAMKRAGVQWGIGRYLYHLDANWANVNPSGKHYQPKDKQDKYPAFKWDPPDLPVWAVPKDGVAAAQGKPAKQKKTGTKKQAAKEVSEEENKLKAEANFDTAWDAVMQSIGEDDLDAIKALRHLFIKKTTGASGKFLAITDSVAGLSSNEIILLTRIVKENEEATAGHCAGDWRKEAKLPSLGVEVCQAFVAPGEVCGERLTEAQKAGCAIAGIPPTCDKHLGDAMKKKLKGATGEAV